jgi:hypothetical protein
VFPAKSVVRAVNVRVPLGTPVNAFDQVPLPADTVPREDPFSNTSTVDPASAVPVSVNEVGALPAGPVMTGAAGARVSTWTTRRALLAWAPIVDGDLIPASRMDASDDEKPLLLGHTEDEFTGFLAGQLPGGLDARAISDLLIRVPSAQIAERRAAPTWRYRFAWVSPTLGHAAHCLDVPFFFDCLTADHVSRLAGDHPPQALADEVHGAAVRFIRGESPGWPGAPAVHVYDAP